ncbi:MAG: vitamin K epoxide reductase family protein [Desulfobacterales bacterium]|nr:vitamin K epoxide reductase family protein [Desulfobacterales bacterium]
MKFFKSKKQIIPLHYNYYFIPVLLVVLVGLFDSFYLAFSHYRIYTDMAYKSFCAISRSFNCDTVSQSPYSILFGVPVPVWGIIGYAFFLILLVFAWPQKAQKKRIWSILFLLSLGFTVYSIVLAVISSYIIGSYCIMCILSYAVNLLLLYFTWIVRKRFHCESIFKALALDIKHLLAYPKLSIGGGAAVGLGLLLLLMFFPPYWQLTPPSPSTNLPTGMTSDGHPWIGAENPKLVIVEFTDYRCFPCKKMHYFLRRLIQAYPDKIRLVHRHFPMDHKVNPIVDRPYHEGAAKLAIVSLYAAKKDKFWVMNDILFDLSRHVAAVNIRKLAEQAGIPSEEIRDIWRDQQLWKYLKKDIQAGIKYGLTGTPGFVINDRVYQGSIPAEALKDYGMF